MPVGIWHWFHAYIFFQHKATLILFVGLGFLPQNVSEVGGKKPKNKLRDPKVQIITVGHYCNLKMVVSRTQFLFACTTVYRFGRRFKHLASARLRFQ
jgi:hypothetical protein